MGKTAKQKLYDELTQQMRRLAGAKVNDAVKLAYLSEEDWEKIDGMDLTALAELKRGSNGVMELKFIDRTQPLERLLELCREDPAQTLLQNLAGGADE